MGRRKTGGGGESECSPMFSHAVFEADTSLKGGAVDFHGGPRHCPEGGRRRQAEARTAADNRLVGN